jgi:4a-hydroxytetrahydrobiopterin dehydratase
MLIFIVEEMAMNELRQRHCVPCEGGVRPLKGQDLVQLVRQLSGWEVVNEHHLTKSFAFKDFAEALAFVNRVGAVAEAEGHHPDIYLGWGRVRVESHTHAVDGLTENDFILAAKSDDLLNA